MQETLEILSKKPNPVEGMPWNLYFNQDQNLFKWEFLHLTNYNG